MTREEQIRSLMQENIVLAVGCTEPVAVALAVAKAKEVLQEQVESVELQLSKNIIKNAMGVGIPGTGMIGLPIAVSLGVVCGESCKELQVLESAKDNLEQAKQWMNSHSITIKSKDTSEKLYIECCCCGKSSSARVIIAKNHLNFVHIQKDDEVIFHKEPAKGSSQEKETATADIAASLSFKEVYDYANNTPIDFLEWIDDMAKVNTAISQEGQKGHYGLQIGRCLLEENDINTRKKIIGAACAASDARMDGATLPVYSNSGSGNQGITCSVPVIEYAKRLNKSKEKTIRALTLSNLVSIYIKSKIGRLSALCGLVNASIGVGTALVYLKGGSFTQICYTVRNMINTITGMVCDGAKPSCALKMSAGLNSAFDSALLAMNNIVVDQTDGIAQEDIDLSIESLGKIGRYGMDKMDELVLDIMLEKGCK